MVIRVQFNGSCLKQDKITYANRKIVNTYIVYEVNKNYNISSYPTLENCLFAAVSLTKIMILISIIVLDMILDLIERKVLSRQWIC